LDANRIIDGRHRAAELDDRQYDDKPLDRNSRAALLPTDTSLPLLLRS
jgi:hypothetical protein